MSDDRYSTAAIVDKIADDAITQAALMAGFSMPRAGRNIAHGLTQLLTYEDGQLSPAQERERVEGARRLARAWSELVAKDDARKAVASWRADV